MMHTTSNVTAGQDGLSLREFVASRLDISRRKAKDIIDSRLVFVNGRCVWMARHRLRRGDTIELPPDAAPARKRGGKLSIVYEQNGIIGVDKPAGILAVGNNSLESQLRKHFGNPRLQMIHRLDRNTTGCLLAAQSQALRDALVVQFRDNIVTKVYHTIVHGQVQMKEQTVTAVIGAQRAVSHIRVLDSNRRASHLSIRIETGRTHQIRKHMAGIRHPVLGDLRHGRSGDDGKPSEDAPVRRQMLHSASVRFRDPETGENVCARAPLPPDMRTCLKQLHLK